MMMLINDAAGNVGAVIADSFQCSQQIGPDEAGFDGAAALLWTCRTETDTGRLPW